MRTLLCLLSCFAGLWFCQSQELRITEIKRDQDQTILSWSGGAPPYQLQRSVDLSDWRDFGEPVEEVTLSLDGDESLQFYRVMSLASVPAIGEYLGQLRVAEGEFGFPLARHRLKSIWDFYYPEGSSEERTALGFFSTLIAKVELLEGAKPTLIAAPLGAFMGGTITSTDRTIRSTWSSGAGEAKRDYTLDLSFRYDVSQRRPKINLSDPTYKLRCRYAVPQLHVDRAGELGTTREDEVELVEIEENSNAPDWWRRKVEVAKGEVSIDAAYEIGVPNIEGGPAFIFKTPLLTQWAQTRITGLTTDNIELKSRFSQTYFPFHHNFVETLYLEPQLEPGISEEILTELRALNIRFIIPSEPTAFPNSESSLKVIGFDDTIRSLE